MKLALITDWLLSLVGGGEKVVQSLQEMYRSPIYTLISNPKKLKGSIFEKSEIHNSFIQKLPFSKKKYKNYFPLFPLAIEQFDLSNYELILSCSHVAAKGVLTHAEQWHICYCHSPARYAWDLYQQYLKESNLTKGIRASFAKFFLHRFRMWDTQSVPRVDQFIANSSYIARRIQKVYGRASSVIYPPVNTSFFSLEKKKEDFYLTASRMVPYKKIDLIVEAFGYMPERRLIVIGDGPDRKKIESVAKKNVEILGEVSDARLKEYLQKAKAFVFAAVEDFGILPVEAQSCGTPVIALKRGGLCETVIDRTTGIFYEEQTLPSLIEAVNSFEEMQSHFDASVIANHARKFDVERFKLEIKQFVENSYSKFLEKK